MPFKKQRRRGRLPWRERSRPSWKVMEGNGRQWKAMEGAGADLSGPELLHRNAQLCSVQLSKTDKLPACHTHRQTAQQTDCTPVRTVFTPARRPPLPDTGTPAIERQGFSLAIHIFSVAAQTLDPPLPTPFGEPASLKACCLDTRARPHIQHLESLRHLTTNVRHGSFVPPKDPPC